MGKFNYEGPIVLVIMDGVGLSSSQVGNAVYYARTSFLDYVVTKYPSVALQASGPAVGVAPGQMGNSEIGHNVIGSGQIFKQAGARIQAAIDDGTMWQSGVWYNVVDRFTKNPNSTLHFAGILSDGGVHSDIRQLEAMIRKAYEAGARKIRVHALFDGRDVAPQSEPRYIDALENFFTQFEGADFKIASGAGRMFAVADRYGSNWNMVKIGWDMMVHGKATYHFSSANEAIDYFRRKNPNLQDQNIPAFVIDDAEHHPVGTIQDGDTMIYFDFRADRAIEITRAFVEDDFTAFDRGPRPDVFFVGMTEYDTDQHLPKNQLVPPLHIKNTLSDLLGGKNIPSLAVSETVKFGHITYYFNGNSYMRHSREEFIEVPSDKYPFDYRPWMKSAEITDAVLERLKTHKFIRINYPGGDMIGHTAKMQPTIVALEAIDIQLQRLAAAVDAMKGMMIITADHGNAEQLISPDGRPQTSHSTNPVPCIFYDNTENRAKYQLADITNPGLANIAATIATLLDETPLAIWQKSLII